MKQTAIQQAIVMVRSRMESMNDTLMGKHTAHHLQQVERDLYELLKEEYKYIGECKGNNDNGCFIDSPGHDCGCFKRIEKEETKQKMKKKYTELSFWIGCITSAILTYLLIKIF